MGAGAAALAELRRRIMERYDALDVHLVASGTQALQMALGRRPSPVALPCFACYDVASAAVWSGRPVVFYDVEPTTLAPEPQSLRRALEDGATTVVVAPLFGLPVDVSALRDLARSAGAALVEDAAQGHGASVGQRPLGSFGDVSILSFGRGKGWTGGGGGALLLRGPGDAGEIAAPGPYGTAVAQAPKALAQWAFGRPTAYALPSAIPALHLGETRYHPPRPPRSMTPFSARLALQSEGASAEEALRRIENAEVLRRILFAPGLDTPDARAIHAPGQPGYLRLPILVEDARRIAATGEGQRLGIRGAYPRLLPDLTELRGQLVFPTSDYPGGRQLLQRLLTLPTHSLLREADLRDIGRLVRRA